MGTQSDSPPQGLPELRENEGVIDLFSLVLNRGVVYVLLGLPDTRMAHIGLDRHGRATASSEHRPVGMAQAME
jgi:hypothetical protein